MYTQRKTCIFKTTVWMLSFVFLTSYSITPAYAKVLTHKHYHKKHEQVLHKVKQKVSKLEKERFAKGRVIVKYKNADAFHVGSMWEQSSPANSTSNLKRVFRKYKAKKQYKLGQLSHDQWNTMKIKRWAKKVKFHKRKHVNVENVQGLENVYVIEVDAQSDIKAMVEELRLDENVVYAQVDHKLDLMGTQFNDPDYDQLWGLDMIDAPQAWDISQGQDVVVAVVDAGIEYTHPDLIGSMWVNPNEIPGNGLDDDNNGFVDDIYGWDFGDKDNDPGDTVVDHSTGLLKSHGTQVAGIIAASADNGVGVVGLAPLSKIMAVKVIPDEDGFYSSNAALGIEYAALNGADVINSAWTCHSSCENPVLEDAIGMAHELGSVVVMPAGDDNRDLDEFSPRNINEPILVAASTSIDTMYDHSNWGAKLDVAAPGVGIYTTSVDHSYEFVEGSSFATAYVSALAALILSNHSDYTNEEVRHVIRASADDMDVPGFDIRTGHGRINAHQALLINSPIDVEIANPTYYRYFKAADLMSMLSGRVVGEGLRDYTLEYRPYDHSADWMLASGPFDTQVTDGELGDFPFASVDDNQYLLKLSAVSSEDRVFEDVIRVNLFHPSEFTFKIADQVSNVDEPKIEGPYIAWLQNVVDTSIHNLFVYNIDEGSTTQVTFDKPVFHFDIEGNKLLYLDGSDFYLYDMVSGQTDFLFSDAGMTSIVFALTEDYVVYQTFNESTQKWHLHAYNISTKEMADLPVSHSARTISIKAVDNTVVFSQEDVGLSFFDLVNGTNQLIFDEDSALFEYDGQRVVFADSDFPDTAVYVYDLLSKETMLLVDVLNAQTVGVGLSNEQVSFTYFERDSGLYRNFKMNLLTEELEELTDVPVYYRDSISMNKDRVLWLERDNFDTRQSAYVLYLHDENGDPQPQEEDNVAPVLNFIGDQSVDEGELLSFTVSAFDEDVQALSFSHPLNGELPEGSSFTLNADAPGQKSGVFSWTPDFEQAGMHTITFTVSDGVLTDSETIIVTVNDSVDPLSEKPVEWIDSVGVSVSGNTIIKTAVNGWENGGAASLYELKGDGYFEFSADVANKFRMAGLSSVSYDTNYLSIEYAIYPLADGTFRIYEKGVNLGNFGAYTLGDRFRIERTGSTVEYKKNGELIYTSTVASSGDLIADASIFTQGGDISDAMIAGATYPDNFLPKAEDINVTAEEDMVKAITLNATDADGDVLSYSIVTPPVNGVLSGTAPNMLYTPDPSFSGADSFTYRANDGTGDSNVATVNIIVVDVDAFPVEWIDLVGVSVNGNTIVKTAGNGWENGGAASLQTIKVDGYFDFRADTTNKFRMAGLSSFSDDANYLSIEYAIYPLADGTFRIYEKGVNLGNFGPYTVGDRFRIERTGSTIMYKKNGELIYTSAVASSGELLADASIFTQGGDISDAKIAGIFWPNNVPMADDLIVTTDEDVAQAITLSAVDADNDSLNYSIVSLPSNGVLSGNAPNMLYTPDVGFSGADSFTFKVSDGEDESNIATVSITVVAAPNNVPVANDQSVSTDEGVGKAIMLGASDADGDPLSYSIVSLPTSGVLSGTAPNLLYTPNPGFSGNDSFTFKVSDGEDESNIATVSITVVAAPNNVPVAEDQSVSTDEGVAKTITLGASDADGDPLSYSVVSLPANGVLSGTAPEMLYTPNAGFSGADSFTFKVSDGEDDSNMATVDIVVVEIPIGPQSADIISPVNGSTITSSTVVFEWTQADTRGYKLKIGSNRNASDIFNGRFKSDVTKVRVSDIPLDGKPLYVKFGYKINGAIEWKHYKYSRIDASDDKDKKRKKWKKHKHRKLKDLKDKIDKYKDRIEEKRKEKDHKHDERDSKRSKSSKKDRK